MVSQADLEQAAELLRQGRLVAFPTETVYGLGANALDEQAIRRIYLAKGRPSSSPLIVHVKSVAAARDLATNWPETADRLARRFWPGPLTLVVPKQPVVPDAATAGLASVGLRMPAHPIALALLECAGTPIAAPSANRFAALSPTTAEHVRASLGDTVDLILDGGSTPVGIESTVVSLVGARPVMLRPGMITRDEVEAVVGPLGMVAEGAAHLSPGLHAKHYSPHTPFFVDQRPAGGRGVWLTMQDFGPEPRAVAAALYAKLHELDQDGLDWIAVELPPTTEEWAGIRDRLQRAAARITRDA